MHRPLSGICKVRIRPLRGCGWERVAYASRDRCLDCRGCRFYELALRLERLKHLLGANAQLCRQLVYTGFSNHALTPNASVTLHRT